MRILLIRPPVPPFTIGLKHIMICEPLELEYTAAGLGKHDVEIFDMILEHGLQRKLNRFRPQVVGTSCYITGVNEVIKICRAVKRWDAGCVTVVGGVQASQVPEDFCDEAVDIIVRGDGTTKMPEIVAALEQGASFDGIPGLALPESCGDLRFTGSAPYMPNPESLPNPRRDLTAKYRHRYYYLFHQPVATIKTTWGCWYDCNFCYTWRITGGKVFSRSPESVVREIGSIAENDIYIVDDIFLIQQRRLAKLAQLLREKHIHKNFLVYSRADFVAGHEKVISEWAHLGLKAVIVGLEATTNPELDSMNKNCTVECNRRAVEVLRHNGVDIYASFIPGPEYQKEDWARLRRFIEETGIYYVNISPLTPLPGTTQWRKYERTIWVDRKAHGLWDLSHCVLPTRTSLKEYYRSLLGVYVRTSLNVRRAKRLALRTRPPVWSYRYLRLWFGALKISLQFLGAYRHHRPANIARAMYRGEELEQNSFGERTLHETPLSLNRSPKLEAL